MKRPLPKAWSDFFGGRLPVNALRRMLLADMDRDGAQSAPRLDGPPLDGDVFDAPARLKVPSYFYGEGMLGQWGRADWQHVPWRLRLWSARFSELARKHQIPIYTHSAFRTEAQQEALFNAGRSKLHWPYSAHCIGEAVDIVHGQHHWELSRQEWQFLSVLGFRAVDLVNQGVPKEAQLQLEWGGSWRFYDPAHWQIAGYQQRIRRLLPGEPVRLTPRGILAGKF